jgi:hypothetical protein
MLFLTSSVSNHLVVSFDETMNFDSSCHSQGEISGSIFRRPFVELCYWYPAHTTAYTEGFLVHSSTGGSFVCGNPALSYRHYIFSDKYNAEFCATLHSASDPTVPSRYAESPLVDSSSSYFNRDFAVCSVRQISCLLLRTLVIRRCAATFSFMRMRHLQNAE